MKITSYWGENIEKALSSCYSYLEDKYIREELYTERKVKENDRHLCEGLNGGTGQKGIQHKGPTTRVQK